MLHCSYPTKPFINDVINEEAIEHRDRIVDHDNTNSLSNPWWTEDSNAIGQKT
jgi:hypothetical protein